MGYLDGQRSSATAYMERCTHTHVARFRRCVIAATFVAFDFSEKRITRSKWRISVSRNAKEKRITHAAPVVQRLTVISVVTPRSSRFVEL